MICLYGCQRIDKALEGKWVFDHEAYLKELELNKAPNMLKKIIEQQIKAQYHAYYLSFHQKQVKLFLGENEMIGQYEIKQKSQQIYELILALKLNQNIESPKPFPLNINLPKTKENMIEPENPTEYLYEKMLNIEFKNNILYLTTDNQNALTFKKKQ